MIDNCITRWRNIYDPVFYYVAAHNKRNVSYTIWLIVIFGILHFTDLVLPHDGPKAVWSASRYLMDAVVYTIGTIGIIVIAAVRHECPENHWKSFTPEVPDWLLPYVTSHSGTCNLQWFQLDNVTNKLMFNISDPPDLERDSVIFVCEALLVFTLYLKGIICIDPDSTSYDLYVTVHMISICVWCFYAGISIIGFLYVSLKSKRHNIQSKRNELVQHREPFNKNE